MTPAFFLGAFQSLYALVTLNASSVLNQKVDKDRYGKSGPYCPGGL